MCAGLAEALGCQKKTTEATEKVKSRNMSFREASVCFNVPRSTLARRVLERNKVACGGKKHLGHYFPTFNTEFEAELVKYVKDMEPSYFGVPCIETHLFHFGNRKRRHMCDQPASTSQLRRSSLFC